MRDDLYYDPASRQPLCREDGVPWEERSRDRRAPFVLHPSGVPVFLPPEDLADEYTSGDPYGAGENFDAPFHARRREVTVSWLAEVGPHMRVLDVGCGEGHISECIRRLPGVELVCALDRSLTAVTKGQKLFSEIEFSVCDANSLPFADSYFDAVVCNNLWEHVATPMTLAAEMRRVLHQGGYVLISTPSRYRFENILKLMRGHRPVRMSPHHLTEYTVGQTREMLEWGGFELLRSGSPSISPAASGWHRVVVPGLKKLLELSLILMRSDHCLESTVFYLARRRAEA